MPFKIFKNLFPKLTLEQLLATKNNAVGLRTNNNLNIKQLGICIVKLSHKNNVLNCSTRQWACPIGDTRYRSVGHI